MLKTEKKIKEREKKEKRESRAVSMSFSRKDLLAQETSQMPGFRGPGQEGGAWVPAACYRCREQRSGRVLGLFKCESQEWGQSLGFQFPISCAGRWAAFHAHRSAEQRRSLSSRPREEPGRQVFFLQGNPLLSNQQSSNSGAASPDATTASHYGHLRPHVPGA